MDVRDSLRSFCQIHLTPKAPALSVVAPWGSTFPRKKETNALTSGFDRTTELDRAPEDVQAWGWFALKVDVKRVTTGEKPMSVDEQVRREIRTFLKAIDSYPESFARDPRITFEEHCSRLIRTVETHDRTV